MGIEINNIHYFHVILGLVPRIAGRAYCCCPVDSRDKPENDV